MRSDASDARDTGQHFPTVFWLLRGCRGVMQGSAFRRTHPPVEGLTSFTLDLNVNHIGQGTLVPGDPLIAAETSGKASREVGGESSGSLRFSLQRHLRVSTKQ